MTTHDELVRERVELGRARSLLHATQFVLGERERELLELKGPCSSRGCRLHYAHAGPCDIRPDERRRADPVKGLGGHGWTGHGHPCCELETGDPPVIHMNCGGPGTCAICTVNAASIHMRGGGK